MSEVPVLGEPTTPSRAAWVGPPRGGRDDASVAVTAAVAGGTALAVLTMVRVLVSWPAHLWMGLAASLGVAVVAAVAARVRQVTGRGGADLANLCGLAAAITCVVVVFLIVVVGLGRVPTEDERAMVVLSMVAAAASAVAFEPLRRSVATRVRHALRRDATDPAQVLELFGARIRRDVPLDEVLLQVAETLRRSMEVDSAEVWTFASGSLRRRTSVPDRPRAQIEVEDDAAAVAARAGVVGPTWLQVWLPDLLGTRSGHLRAAPLSFSGELLGLLVVERDAGDLTASEETILAELGGQVGLALHNTQLDHALQDTLDEVRRQARELEASRRRLVTASDEERRRIERNLHDGAQQHLVALSVGLNLAGDMIADDPVAATEMVTQLQVAVQDTIEELRALAHGIYPPLLRDSGLDAALRAAATRSPLDVTVDAGAVGRVPADIEAAVYFCCLEALQNSAKHAPAARVSITLGIREGGLFFEVDDDGPGFADGAVVHSAGFTNMADRVGAVGGRVDWTSRPGDGVSVAGVIPLPR